MLYQQVAALVRWLMAPNPAQRPTAAEVLASDVLPPLVGDEQLKVRRAPGAACTATTRQHQLRSP